MKPQAHFWITFFLIALCIIISQYQSTVGPCLDNLAGDAERGLRHLLRVGGIAWTGSFVLTWLFLTFPRPDLYNKDDENFANTRMEDCDDNEQRKEL